MITNYIETYELINWLKFNGISNSKEVMKKLIKYEVVKGVVTKENLEFLPYDEYIHFINNHVVYSYNNKNKLKPKDTLSLSEISSRLGITRNTLEGKLKHFSNIIMFCSSRYIPLNDVIEYERTVTTNDSTHNLNIINNPDYVRSDTFKDWLSKNGIQYTKKVMLSIINEGLIKNPIKAKDGPYTRWYFHRNDYDNFINNYEVCTILNSKNEETNSKTIKPKGTLSVREVAQRWNIVYKNVYKKFWNGRINKNDLVECLGTLYIPLELIESYEKLRTEESEPTTLEKLVNKLEQEVRNKLVQVDENATLYLDFFTRKLRQSNASLETMKSRTSKYIAAFEYIGSLTKNMRYLSDNEVKLLLQNNKIPSSIREELGYLLEAVDRRYGNLRNSRTKVNRNSTNKTNENPEAIYDYKVYLEYCELVKNTEYLIPSALNSQSVANFWLYIIMLLTNNWRGPDIIKTLPRIDLHEIGIQSLSWFESNTLSMDQALSIFLQIRLKIKNNFANKNKEKLRFFEIPEFVIPFAISAIISELHIANDNETLLLKTLNNKSISKHHRRIFINHPHLNSDFLTRKMNRSTMTYLFYSIIEEDGDDADLALELVSKTRSHRELSSTEIYLNVSNKEGSINRVSVNLFKRGHFGWLYNYIVSMALEGKKGTLDLEEKSTLIMTLRNDYSPRELEDWAEFLAHYEKRKSSVITELSTMPKKHFIKLIKAILQGKMPSRTEGVHCILNPNCPTPHRTSCLGCQYGIPQALVLLEATDELKRLSINIKKSKYESLLIRDSRFFAYTLMLFNEAYSVFDSKYLNAYISRKEFTNILSDVLPYLHLKDV